MKRVKIKDFNIDTCRKLPVMILVSAMMCLSSLANGQNLADYLKIAAENHPGLQAAYSRYTASLERIPQVGSLPDPELSFGVYLQDMATLMGNQRFNTTLMQRFPWFGTLQAGKDEASLMAKANFQEFETEKYALFYEVKTDYYQLYLLHHHVMIANKNLQLLQRMEELSLNKFKGGIPGKAGKMTDVLRIQSETKVLEARIAALEDALAVAQVKFNLLLNRPENEPVNMDASFWGEELLLGKEVVLDSILTANPQVKKLEWEGQAYRKKGEAARLKGLPSFGVGLNYMINSPRQPAGAIDSPMGYTPGGMGHNMIMPMVSVSVPIFRRKYKSAQRESAYYREASVLAKEDLTNALKSSWEEQYRLIREAKRNVKLYEEQVVLLRKTLDLMIADYSSAEGSFEELLTVQRQLLDFEMKTAEETFKKLQAFAKLESLMAKGISL
ncbi:TolC family protein [Echinicola soli]|uniref:TolC family protein n=1 Tax=Echinicola soli TaxID=2591634 RepID=A0A514CIK5_9BACT|nr:TolC family protein [Echinicola soli]QDH79645.1 TolC family protein [Echinicola soli]